MRVEIRPMEKGDESFVYASWLKNYKACSVFAKRIRNDIFFKKHHAVIEYILAKPTTRVMIANNHKDPDHILGFLCFEDTNEGQVVHFAFVKAEFQKLGIGKKLFVDSGIDLNNITFTHLTYAANELMSKYSGISHDPYYLNEQYEALEIVNTLRRMRASHTEWLIKIGRDNLSIFGANKEFDGSQKSTLEAILDVIENESKAG